jgi:hypothetical protein
MYTLTSVRIDTWWLYEEIGCTIGGLDMKVQYASPQTTPTCIVRKTNATSNVAVGLPVIPRLPVAIITRSIHLQIRLQVAGSLSPICLTSSHFLSCPLACGLVTLRGSLVESFILSLLIF